MKIEGIVSVNASLKYAHHSLTIEILMIYIFNVAIKCYIMYCFIHISGKG